MKHLNTLSLVLLFLLAYAPLCAQDNANMNDALPQLSASKITQKISIDGLLNEPEWEQQIQDTQTPFRLNFPNDVDLAQSQTEVKVLFDDNFLYIAATCYDSSPEKKNVVSSLKRDFQWDLNENFNVYIDPFQDKLNGFCFTSSIMGVQLECLMSDGSSFDCSWDTWWLSAVKRYETYWTVEMAIPFRVLRYKDMSSTWGINFARNNTKNNQISTWARVPQAYSAGTLAFCGALNFSEPVKRMKANVALIPYVSGQTGRDYVNNTKQNIPNLGTDAKVAVTSSLNLDLTVNPDFSQVEVDRQVTNLSRFEIFFPERRQFFVENSDLFSRFGFRNLRPFFSRRIGIGFDTTTQQIVQNPIIYGARLSGRLDEKWRIGAMNIQTAANNAKGIQAQNYSVAAVQRQIFTRSNIALIGVNRQVVGDSNPDERYKRMLGADFNYQSKDNKWWAKVFYHRAFDPLKKSQNHSHAGFLNYRSRKFNIWWNHEYAGQNYDINDIGFVSRNAMWRFEPIFEYFMYPKSKKIFRFGLKSYNNMYMQLDRKITDVYQEIEFSTELLNTMQLTFWIFRDYTYLFFPFNPANNPNKPKLPENTDYQVNGWAMYFNTDIRKPLNMDFYVNYGGYYLGTKLEMNGTINYRVQPYGSLALDVTYNAIEQTTELGNAYFLLVAPRIDASFSRSLFLTTFLQYNTQTNNFNINSRLQWRFKPVSDLFLVYSDNYGIDDGVMNTANWIPKSRALVLKLTYFIMPRR